MLSSHRPGHRARIACSEAEGDGLPAEFRFHNVRSYLASLLIGSGLDVKVVHLQLRHGSAKTTLDTYGHLWPDSDESARAAVGNFLATRAVWRRLAETKVQVSG